MTAHQDPSRITEASSWAWPEAATLNLEETYEQLRRLDALQRQIEWDVYQINNNIGNHEDVRYEEEEEDDADIAEWGAAKVLPISHDPDVQSRQADLDYEIATCRTALRARAMQLSRGKIRQISVLDLPLDILHSIFDLFRFQDVTPEGRQERRMWARLREDSSARIATVQNARLACRLFCEIASPLLIPAVVVRLNEESLARVEKISQAPLLAAGVQGVELRLEYRPGELATDLAQFVMLRRTELESYYRRCEHVSDLLYRNGDRQEVDDPECPQRRRNILTALANCRQLFQEWDQLSHPLIGDPMMDETAKYKRTLLQAHGEYRRKHEEQLRLVTDGSFAHRLASAMALMPRFEFLDMLDLVGDHLNWHWEEPETFMATTEGLSRFLETPHSWKTIEETIGEAEIPPAELLWQIPCAMHKAGAPLREFHVNCFPVMGGFKALCPGLRNAQQAGWDSLRAACQSLEIVRFARGGGRLNSRPRRSRPLSAEEESYVDKFLASVLLGPCLEVVDLHFSPLGGFEWESRSTSWYHMGWVVETPAWPRIKRFLLTGASISQRELEQLCSGLGRGLTYLELDNVRLQSGSWAGALDILQEKVAASRLEGDPEVTFTELEGGEFRNAAADRPPRFASSEALIGLSQDYVSGTRSLDNPLR
ncbi:hypothetical protein GQ53DRAFT_462577 [Thozetella sp. PMI_491]|nr:hypothetical protein GQ53DRAFT_462577 [Thozetella sp. PMI_491]